MQSTTLILEKYDHDTLSVIIWILYS